MRLGTFTGPRRRARSPVELLGAAGIGTAFGLLLGKLNRRRRHTAVDRTASAVRHGMRNTRRRAEYTAGKAQGVRHAATSALHHEEREYDDITLARKIESEVFRDADAPKGSVNVNVIDGIVELRGQVQQPEQVKALGDAVAAVDGVRGVENLLHTPGSEPGHTPPGRFRGDRAKSKSRAEDG
jgi:osmotically-inducible protein OsmY